MSYMLWSWHRRHDTAFPPFLCRPNALPERRGAHEQDDYLILLGTLGKGGRSRTEIATHILVRELQTLEKEGYHERRLPKPKVG